MITVRTKPASSGHTPSFGEMAAAAEVWGVKKYSPALVADFVHFNEGGSFNPPSCYRPSVLTWAKATKPDNWREEFQARMAYHSRVRDFVESFPLHRMPGATALEKAMGLMKLLEKQGITPSGFMVSNDDQQEAEGASEAQISALTSGTLDPAEQILKALDVLESLSEAEKELCSDMGYDNSALNALEIVEILMSGSTLRRILEVNRSLDAVPQLSIRKTRQTVRDASGDHVRQRRIAGVHEIGQLSPKQLAESAYLPEEFFLLKVLQGQYAVEENYRIENKKQVIFILLDVSGSVLNSPAALAVMCGIVMNRLKAVVSDDAIVYLGVFNTVLKILGKAETPDEAKKLMKRFRKMDFLGGGTNIGAGIRAAHGHIEKVVQQSPDLIRPQIVVLTDDDPSTGSIKPADIPGTVVNGFAFQNKNASLVNLCRLTGGVAFEEL